MFTVLGYVTAGILCSVVGTAAAGALVLSRFRQLYQSPPYPELSAKLDQLPLRISRERPRGAGGAAAEHPQQRGGEVGVTTRQWYLRNGGRNEGLRDRLLERGTDLLWHPPHMKTRYDSWVSGLNGDWLVSRQRYFGVPIPVWYALDDAGDPRWDQPLVPSEDRLPVDPGTDTPDGYTPEQRGEPGGFTGDTDVLDTWATSSLTPQIAGRWGRDDDLFQRVFPMDLRPQAHEIIRTWLFSTVVRADSEHGVLPWRHAAISGWILDPDRKKMSKSKGNVVTPTDLLVQHGSDAVRYWAAGARPGTDTAFDTGQMRIGRRLAVKLLNASKFVLGIGEPDPGTGLVGEPLDRAMLAQLADTVQDATDAFEEFDYARALQRAEAFFWRFCDDYLELVKIRAYGEHSAEGADSARVALRTALSVLVRLFAPFLPFATEEVWSWWQDGSVHRATWPDAAQLREQAGAADRSVLEVASEVIAAVRKAKSDAQVSMRTEVASATISASPAVWERVELASGDLRAAGRIAEVEPAVREGAGLAVTVRL